MEHQWDDLTEDTNQLPDEDEECSPEKEGPNVFSVYRSMIRESVESEQIPAYNPDFVGNEDQWERIAAVLENEDAEPVRKKKRRGCCLFRLVLWALIGLTAWLLWQLIPGEIR